MKKVAIIGSAGSGKSTLAKKIGESIQLPVIHMDTLFWEPGWTSVSKEILEKKHEQVLVNDCWVIDGNYSKVWEKRLQMADTIIFLDMPRRICLYRVIKRFFQYRHKTRPDLTEGCEEKIDLEFLRYIWGYPKKGRLKALQVMKRFEKEKKTFILTSKRDVTQFLQQISKVDFVKGKYIGQ